MVICSICQIEVAVVKDHDSQRREASQTVNPAKMIRQRVPLPDLAVLLYTLLEPCRNIRTRAGF